MKLNIVVFLGAFAMLFSAAQVKADSAACAEEFKKCTAKMTKTTADMSHGSKMGHQSECAFAHAKCDVTALIPTYGIFGMVPAMVVGHLSWLNDNLWSLGETLATPRPGNSNYKE